MYIMKDQNNYLKLKIPFATKSFIKEWNQGLKIKGNAYYIFDLSKNIYVDEYLEIESANFRLTDFNMLKTAYYSKKLFKDFRKKYLDILSNKKPENILKTSYIDLNEYVLNKVNSEFRKMNTTIRNMFACLSGSNPPGAESKHGNTPLICTEPNYFKCNFLNPLNIFAAKKPEKNKTYNDTNIKIVDLGEFLSKYSIHYKNTYFKDAFRKYNDFKKGNIENINNYFIENDLNYSVSNLKLNEDCFKDKLFKEKNDNFELFIDGYLNKTLSKNIEWNQFKLKLRNFYTWNVSYCINNKYLSPISTLQEHHKTIIDNAHIISFASLIGTKSRENILKSIDPYNCLRIDKNSHALYDNKTIYFDLEGNIIQSNGTKIPYLNMNLLAQKQKKYLEQIRIKK